MPRGGKRPGAGAPKGNINALKHGRRSRQIAKLGAIIAASPTANKILLRLADRREMEGQRADELAARIIDQVVARGLKRGRDRLVVLPPLDYGRTIRRTRAAHRSSESAQSQKVQNTPPNNQSVNTRPNDQSENS